MLSDVRPAEPVSLSGRPSVTQCAQGDWLKVRVRGGKEGWMQRQLADGRVILEECTSYRR